MNDDTDIQRIEAAVRRYRAAAAELVAERDAMFAVFRELNERADDPWCPGDIQTISDLSRETLRRRGVHEVVGGRQRRLRAQRAASASAARS